ncbi:MAG TPA: glycosyltransferase family 1 protein, partial [Rhodanobacteraceae bacterium]
DPCGTDIGHTGPAVIMDLVCVSHLRWDFVFQRPQHLLSRAARERRVFYVEEPKYHRAAPTLQISAREGGVQVVVPMLDERVADPTRQPHVQRELVDRLLARERVRRYVLWYYTPMALLFTHHLHPDAVVYDCMDELSAFAGAPPQLRELERELFRRAHVVFTGGQSLYEAKRQQHANVHAFPSSVDVAHFAQARTLTSDPADQAAIPHPRVGFFGVIDERMDYELLRGAAAARPSHQFVLIGPTAKIDPASLPRTANLHYLGGKTYAELPRYIAGWDVAMLPFARNDATRFISPTKTPEYLAAGKPVVSTSIRDVVRPYGQQGLARIADTVDDFVAAIDAALAEPAEERLLAADAFLTHLSWDGTWTRMRRLIDATMADHRQTGKTAALSAS